MQNTNIGDRVRSARQKQELSMQEFIDIVNTDPERPQPEKDLLFDRYKSWEYGVNAIPLGWIPTLCKHLSCDAGYLFGVYDDLKLELANITSSTGFSTEAANVIDDLDRVGGNSRFVEVEKGTLSKRYILSQLIADDRIFQVLIAAKQAKSLKYNMRKNVDPDVTADDFSEAIYILSEMNMVALRSDDSVNFYIQEAGRVFMDILRTLVDGVSDNETYSTDLVALDSSITIKKFGKSGWIVDEKTATKPTPAP